MSRIFLESSSDASRDVSRTLSASVLRRGAPSRMQRARMFARRLSDALRPRVEVFGRALWNEEPNAVIGAAIAVVLIGGAGLLAVDLITSIVRHAFDVAAIARPA